MAKAASRLDTLRNLEVAQWDVAFAAAFGSLVGGSLLIGFIQHLKGGDLIISLTAAIPALAGLAQIPGAIWGRSYAWHKKFIAPGGWLWRILYLPLAILPILPFAPELRIWAAICCIGLAALSISIVQPIFNDWLAEMVPATSRGAYYSRRILIATAAGAGTGLLGGIAMDWFEANKMEAAGFSIVFGFAWCLGITSMLFFSRMSDTPRANPVKPQFAESMRQLIKPAADKNFAILLVFTIIFAISQGYAGQYFAAYSREILKLPFTVIQLLGVSHTISTILFVKMWGFLGDRYGNKPILALVVAGTAITPFQWMFLNAENQLFNIIFLISTHMFNGFVWSGVGVTQGNLYIATAPPEDRPNYLAAASAASALAMFVAPLLGYASLHWFRSLGSAEDAYKLLFTVIIGIRAAGILALMPVKEPGAASIRAALSQLVKVRPKGVKAMRQIAASTDQEARAEAIQAVGDTKMALGSEELVKALSDPSPKVRRRAARALSQVPSAVVAAALISHLEEHPNLADEETLEALGESGGTECTGLLVGFLKDPRAFIRRAAARALGSSGDPAAIPHLIEASREVGDSDLRRAALQALRLLEAKEAADVYAEGLWDQHPSIRSASAEAISELELKELAPTLRESVKWFGDETASEMAYALGAVGNEEDLGSILAAASHMASEPLRRRCLMGAARLLGVEPEFYRLVRLEGMSRDQELLKRLQSGIRSKPEWLEAVSRYSSESEMAAIQLLFKDDESPAATELQRHSVPELFLVAALHAAHAREAPARQ